MANKSLSQEQVNPSITQSHPQAHYTSRKLAEILVQETQVNNYYIVNNCAILPFLQ
ncbi:hypothetical protein RhiirA5_442795 [Rhizophagus irregularis]|uniref:Uncharacterized protein n=1 Tax=Rhizophagus irregularis TaxID=588596 RepID=A0A2N0NEF5_9GLOM|nr:hypothetical protein RhiirA5_442795 [Rhizophagus irregularis]